MPSGLGGGCCAGAAAPAADRPAAAAAVPAAAAAAAAAAVALRCLAASSPCTCSCVLATSRGLVTTAAMVAAAGRQERGECAMMRGGATARAQRRRFAARRGVVWRAALHLSPLKPFLSLSHTHCTCDDAAQAAVGEQLAGQRVPVQRRVRRRHGSGRGDRGRSGAHVAAAAGARHADGSAARGRHWIYRYLYYTQTAV